MSAMMSSGRVETPALLSIWVHRCMNGCVDAEHVHRLLLGLHTRACMGILQGRGNLSDVQRHPGAQIHPEPFIAGPTEEGVGGISQKQQHQMREGTFL
jgi:hypothetical protein